MQKVWDKIDKVASMGYIHEGRIAALEQRHEEISEEIEKTLRLTQRTQQQIQELDEIVKSYLRGLKNGGSTS